MSQTHTDSTSRVLRTWSDGFAGSWAALREQVDARRTARAERKQLERELASYSTHAQQMELDAMLDRHEGPDVEALRAIVSRQRAA